MNEHHNQLGHRAPNSATFNTRYDQTLFTEHDIYLFKEGTHFRLYDKLGAHAMTVDGVHGTYFAVWAPNALKVAVIGNFNAWNRDSHALAVRWDGSGIWEGFIPGIAKGEVYKYFVVSKDHNYQVEKKDPVGFYNEIAPKTASVTWDTEYQWNDGDWMSHRRWHNSLQAPISIYELYLGSWRQIMEENNRPLSYREIAQPLVDYIKQMGFTHVEFMPVMEYPFDGSWGYQGVGYFSPTSRFGTPQDFMYLIDFLHQNDIGVILDWVPSHFPGDEIGLAYFDGTHLYEHADPRKGFHPDWSSYIFNYGRNEVREFLISSALFWFDKFHVDGLRVDAVASMLYLDYSRKHGEWIPNEYGGRENIDAINFMKRLNEAVYEYYPDVQMIAEESTAWSGVSRPVHLGGLGFGMKWNMGWMHDTLLYIAKDPVYRKYHHNDLTFSFMYSFTENFVLSLSHDEVVHGKKSLIAKMPGDDWQKFANLRLLYAYMYAHPGKKLLFMGQEFAQWDEWSHKKSLDWHLTQYERHLGVQKLVADLNHLYRREKALFQKDFSSHGFEWIDLNDYTQGVISFIRKGIGLDEKIIVVCNFTPATYFDYRVGVPESGAWKEVFNSDSAYYGGSGQGNLGRKETEDVSFHGRPHSFSLTVPPLSVLYLKRE
ncbi:MAG: 1,4-alpha-glucan branching protein GlgB [Candidatus Omnitrophica bacterium]|nr:1,4-alpha-glucan branching protein GlgB [Candidatus Omnitrophota bacterium]